MKSDDSRRSRKIALTIGALLIAADFGFSFFPRERKSHDDRAVASRAPTIALAESVAQVGQISTAPVPRPILKVESAKIPAPLTPVERDLCRIHKLSGIPLDGDLRVQSTMRIDGGSNYWLKSSSCPTNFIRSSLSTETEESKKKSAAKTQA